MKTELQDGLYRKTTLGTKRFNAKLVWAGIGVSLLVIASVFVYGRSLDRTKPVYSNAIKETYTLVAVGDIACDPDSANFNSGYGVVGACQQAAVAQAIKNEQKDGVILIGDIQYDTGEFDDYVKSFVPAWRGVISLLYPAAGNHDYGTGTVAGYTKAFAQYFPEVFTAAKQSTWYGFDIGSWRVRALDSNCSFVGCEEGSAQRAWLNADIANHPSKCSLAFWHHPVFTSGEHRGDGGEDLMRTTFGVLQQSSADVVLNGHDHNYERFDTMSVTGEPLYNGIREFVVGTGGNGLRKFKDPLTAGSQKAIDDQFGYLVIRLKKDRYEWQFKNIQGESLDAGYDICR